MTDTETKPISAQASVAPDLANLKRALQMKLFTTDEQKRRVAFKQEPEAIGQIVGEIYSVKEKAITLKDGSQTSTIMALGDFEASVYATGEVITSPSAYLPRYFLETVQDMIAAVEKTGTFRGMDIAIEIVLVPTGKAIPIAYEVRPLIARRADSAVNRMKQALQQVGRLRLPPPIEAAPLDGEVLAIEHEIPDAEVEPSVSEAEPASPAKRARA